MENTACDGSITLSIPWVLPGYFLTHNKMVRPQRKKKCSVDTSYELAAGICSCDQSCIIGKAEVEIVILVVTLMNATIILSFQYYYLYSHMSDESMIEVCSLHSVGCIEDSSEVRCFTKWA